MKRILFVQGSAERAGGETMLFNLIKYLDRKSFEPAVAFLDEGAFVDEIASLGVTTIRQPRAPRLREVWRWKEAIRSIQGAIQRSRADLVHANGEKMAVFAGQAALAARLPSIAWLHDAPGQEGLAGRFAQWALRRTRFDAVVTCARWMTEEFNRELGLRATTIANGLDLALFPTRAERTARIREELQWPHDAIVVGHFARLQRWKGTDVFLDAASKVSKQRGDIRFLVVGDALYGREVSYARGLRSRSKSLGLDNRLVFTGYRQDALAFMAENDIVAHCSIRPDPFPTVILEGMLLGKAVIATRTKGPEEALEDGTTGILVPPADSEALAEAITTLVESPRLRERLGAEAARTARARYSASRMASDFEMLYRNLMRA